MVFKSLCRHAEIGANSYLLEIGDTRIVLDAGMHPKHEGSEAIPHYEWLEAGSIDAVIVTHSHLDHVGTLPVLMEDQAQAKIFISPEAADLSTAMLHNSVNVMQSKRIELGLAEYPLFTHKDIDNIVENFELRGLHRPFDLDDHGKVRAMFHDAGHILGSVAVSIEAEGKKILYTGDVNFEDATIQKAALLPEEQVDLLIIETTRGDHQRRPDYTREDEAGRLAQAISDCLDRRGAVLIPVFAMGKTQEVLAMVHQFKQNGKIPPKTPVYIGGLSTKMTLIYDRHADSSRRLLPGFRIFDEMDLEAGSRQRKAPIPLRPGCIYALSSGMMTESTVSNGFAREGFLENKKNGLFFVGYADPESPAGQIRSAQPGDDIVLDPKHHPVPLHCEVRSFDFSGHATRDDLLAYMLKVQPKKIALVHGDPAAVEWFRAQLAERAPAIEVLTPQPGTAFEV